MDDIEASDDSNQSPFRGPKPRHSKESEPNFKQSGQSSDRGPVQQKSISNISAHSILLGPPPNFKKDVETDDDSGQSSDRGHSKGLEPNFKKDVETDDDSVLSSDRGPNFKKDVETDDDSVLSSDRGLDPACDSFQSSPRGTAVNYRSPDFVDPASSHLEENIAPAEVDSLEPAGRSPVPISPTLSSLSMSPPWPWEFFSYNSNLPLPPDPSSLVLGPPPVQQRMSNISAKPPPIPPRLPKEVEDIKARNEAREDSLQSAYNQLLKEVEDIKAREDSLQSAYNQLRKEVEDIKARNEAREDSLQSAYNQKIRELEDIKARYERFLFAFSGLNF